MAIKDVETKCYILALFIRNDGARFLLGSGAYEFKEGQQHFAANTMQNDVVEVQGNDGYLLAGQVRRPGVQSFDGYVGDSSTSKPVVEGLRRDFFQFFRKGYFYKVVYVFPDGSAIQRKRGFLVDAPVVQELYQIYPEYHVALNFEDINYYFYDENDAGEEIYGKSAIVGLSMATGGLVWDEDGAITDPLVFGGVVTVKGADTINNLLNVAVPLASVGLYGDTYQQKYSGKNLCNAAGLTKAAGGTGITVTANEDGSITINGTSTDRYNNYRVTATDIISGIVGQTVTISVQTSGTGSWNNFGIKTVTGSNLLVADNSSNPKTGAIPQSPTGEYSFDLYFPNNITFNNFNMKLQVELGSTATSFEKFVGGIPSPNPDYPQEVQTVTGEQTVTVTGDGGTGQSYAVDLGSAELCKIGDYQDYVYKSGDDWYLHKEVSKASLTGTTGWWQSTHSVKNSLVNAGLSDMLVQPSWNVLPNMVSNYFTQQKVSDITSTAVASGFGVVTDGCYFANNDWSLEEFTAFIANHEVFIYGILATPTDTQITDATLISQLDALGAAKLYVGENNLIVTASGTNLSAELEVGYYTEIEDGYGFVWEEGRSPSNIIAVDSIDDVFPVLTITGETENPILTNVTTGTIFQYNGTITASQTLVVDMMNQTATLNGTSVIGNVTGDWVYFAPGNNRVSYTAGNANAPDATIEWQEIVG